MLPALTVVLGGAASGKSEVAENIIFNSGLERIYLATSQIRDDEMQLKVDRHLAQRGDGWQTIEATIDLDAALRSVSPGQAVLVDCATMWLSNVMLDERDIAEEQARFLAALSDAQGPVVVVTNEVGQGIVPSNALARAFREAQGRLNIALALQADCVLHVLAGLVQVRKGMAP